MSESSRHDQRTYLLGAGASADAGVPLTADLLDVIRDGIRRQTKPRPPQRQLLEFIEMFEPVNGAANHRTVLTDIINLIDSALRDGRPLSRKFNVETLAAVRRQLTVELAGAVSPVGGENNVDVRVPESEAEEQTSRIGKYQRDFVSTLRPRQAVQGKTTRGPGDSVITTNYDTTIDLALYELAYDPDSELTDVFLGSWFKDPGEDEDAFLEPKTTLDLFHLHGALNWLYCQRCSRIFVTAFLQSVTVLDPSKRSRMDRECFCGYTPTEPVIVAPSAFQEIHNVHLLSIWSHSYLALEASGHWILVGYSLPAEDLAVRSLLFRALDARIENGQETRIEVVAKESKQAAKEAIRARYQGALDRPGSAVTLEFKWVSFETYVKSLPRAATQKVPRKPPGKRGTKKPRRI